MEERCFARKVLVGSVTVVGIDNQSPVDVIFLCSIAVRLVGNSHKILPAQRRNLIPRMTVMWGYIPKQKQKAMDSSYFHSYLFPHAWLECIMVVFESGSWAAAIYTTNVISHSFSVHNGHPCILSWYIFKRVLHTTVLVTHVLGVCRATCHPFKKKKDRYDHILGPAYMYVQNS